MSEFKMEVMNLGMVQTNCYLVWNEETKEAVMVDPADRADQILSRISLHGLTLKGILLTHGHFDHMMAAPELKEKTGAPIYAGEAEKELLHNAEWNLSGSWEGNPTTFDADVYVKEGEIVDLCGFSWKVLETPGHTKGGVCYYLEKEGQLFCGDTLFRGSYGRTDLPTGSMNDIMASLRKKILVLPEDTICYPGHMDATVISFERKYNPVSRGMKF